MCIDVDYVFLGLLCQHHLLISMGQVQLEKFCPTRQRSEQIIRLGQWILVHVHHRVYDA